jgi:uncharacterized protein GlcG (DUF336 family)
MATMTRNEDKKSSSNKVTNPQNNYTWPSVPKTLGDENNTLGEKVEESSPQSHLSHTEDFTKQEIESVYEEEQTLNQTPSNEINIPIHESTATTQMEETLQPNTLSQHPQNPLQELSEVETTNSSISSIPLWEGVAYIDPTVEEEDCEEKTKVITLEENQIQVINNLFEVFELHLKEESDLYSKTQCNSMCAAFYLRDGKMFYLTKGEKLSLKMQLAWDRAFTAFELSDETSSKPSSSLYETHGILSMEAQEGIPWRYTNSPGGWPVFNPQDSEIVGGFSICSNNSKYDEKLSRKIILESGMAVEPYIQSDSVKCSENPDGCNVSDNYWLIEYEKMWVLRKRVDNRQIRIDCQHKWKNPGDYFSQRGEYYWALCPLCEKAKETGTLIRRKKRTGKNVNVKRVIINPKKEML